MPTKTTNRAFHAAMTVLLPIVAGGVIILIAKLVIKLTIRAVS